MENPIKMDDLGVPLFLETPTWNLRIHLIEEENHLNQTIIFRIYVNLSGV